MKVLLVNSGSMAGPQRILNFALDVCWCATLGGLLALVVTPGFDRLFRHFVKTTFRTIAAVCRPSCALLVYVLCYVPWLVRGTHLRNKRLGHSSCHITAAVVLTKRFRRI